MNEEREAPMRFPLPPLVLVGCIALAVLLDFLVPLPWIGSPLADILLMVGVFLLLAAGLLVVSTSRTLSRAKTTVRPDRIAAHLVTNGPFKASRNPIYLGMVLLLLGLALILGSIWFALSFLAAGLLLQKLAIEPEERHLESLFGKRYRDYRKSVRRWF